MRKTFVIVASVMALTACAVTPTSNPTNYGVPVMNRTAPERMIDEGIEHTILRNLPNIPSINQLPNHNLRVAVDSFRREVLLTGEVPSEAIKKDIENTVYSMSDVQRVYNDITIDTPRNQGHTLHEQFVKTKLLAKITAKRFVSPSQYKLIVRNNKLYLMGNLTQTQQNQLIDIIKQTQGIDHITLLSNLVVEGRTITNTGYTGTSIYNPTTTNNSVPYANTAPYAYTTPYVHDQTTPYSYTNTNTQSNQNRVNTNTAISPYVQLYQNDRLAP